MEKLRNQWKKKIAAYKAKVTVAEKKEQVENEKKGKKGEEDGSKKIKDTKKDKKKNKEGKDGKEQGVVDRVAECNKPLLLANTPDLRSNYSLHG